MRRLLLAGTILAGLLVGSQSLAQEASAPAAQDRDPEAMAALDKMGAALRKLNSFAMRADTTSEEVLSSGQKLQFTGTVAMTIRRPDGLRASIHTSRQDREIYYDGKKVTVFSPSLGYYAKFDAPPTLKETLKVAADKYGLEIPLADLAMWGTDPELNARIQTAFRVGEDLVAGKICTHYALRQPGVDWQIWLDEAGNGLPCRLLITNRLDPSMPQYSATYSWLTSFSQAPGTFTFAPPKGTHQISIATIQDDNASTGGQ